MQRFIDAVDGLSMWVGKAFAWCILVLTLGTTYEVFMRYVLREPTEWAFDMSYIMYGAMFMMAGAYTLSRNGHVRGDVIYRLWPARVQAGIELTLYVLFFFPGMMALVWAGYDYAGESWNYRPFGAEGPRGEISINSPAGVPVSPLKTLLPIAAGLLLLQGLAEVGRCLICLRSGTWPPRRRDVEETEDQLLARMQQSEAAIEHELGLDRPSSPARRADD